MLVAIALLIASGDAANARPCSPIAFGDAHASLDELAARTLRGLFNEGHRYESGGFFIEKNGVFRASKAVTQRSRNDVSYCIVLPRGARLAGIYHTHVANSAFSPRDRGNAERVGVPTYIGTIRDGSVFAYDGRLRQARGLGDAATGDPSRPPPRNGRVGLLLERLALLGQQAATLVAKAVSAALDRGG